MTRNLIAKCIGTLAIVLTVASAPASALAPSELPVPTKGGMPSLAPMLRQATPAVVNISVTSRVDIQNPLLQDPFFRRFFDVPDVPQEQESQAIGSGTIVDAAKGYILTNNHVIDQADTIKVRLNDDREFPAKLIGRDPDTDIAVLQIKATGLKALTLANSDELEVGDFVVAIGSPFGLRASVTAGIVSGLGRNGMGEGIEDFIQTDASINPGNSGGALVNLRGELVGVPSQILSRSGGNIGIGFAIPVNLARSVMDQIVKYGSVERGRVGIGGQDLDPALAKAFGLPDTRGAVVTQVQAESPADRAGLKSEDVILKVNGSPISSYAQLRNRLALIRVGEKVQLDILRSGKPKTLTLTIGPSTEVGTAQAMKLHPALEGATFSLVDESTSRPRRGQGVLVQRVRPGSPAALIGLRAKDLILSVNREPVTSMKRFEELAGGSNDEMLLHIQRGAGAFFLIVQ